MWGFGIVGWWALVVAMAAVTVGQPVPSIQLTGPERGLLQLTANDVIQYRPFASRRVIPGKVRVIIHMAARLGAKADGRRLTDTLDRANLDPQRFQVLVVLAADDCTFGTCLFVRGQFEDQVRERRNTAFVYDDRGDVRRLWGLPGEAFTAILTDRDGRVVRSKTGTFTRADALTYLKEARALMARTD